MSWCVDGCNTEGSKGNKKNESPFCRENMTNSHTHTHTHTKKIANAKTLEKK